MKYYILTLFLAGLAFIGSCDVIEPPYEEDNDIIPVDTTEYVQKLLIEEYTGHKCGNCPEAAEIAHEIEETYGDRIIVLGVHANFYATVNQKYPTDFRTEVGTELDTKWGFSGYPNGLINRIVYNDDRIIGPKNWKSVVPQILDNEPAMAIELETDYDATSRLITVTANVKYKQGEEPGASHYLSVYLKENHIIAEQEDYRLEESFIKDYEHNNVLRASMNGTWGEQLTDVATLEENTYTVTYTYKIPADKEWVAENIYAVAFIHDFNDSWEIYQAEEEKIVVEQQRMCMDQDMLS